MAMHDHKAPARPAANTEAHSTNPLGRPCWPLCLAEDARQQGAAKIAGLCMGIHALTRILANSEAFRDMQTNCTPVEPGYLPLAADLTQGLFAALYFLGEQVALLTGPDDGDPAFG